MIKELRLKNWKSFAESTLYIDPLTILIGTNASGKSNVLDALQFLQRVSSGVSIVTAIAGDNNIVPLRGGLEWASRKPFKGFSIDVVVGSDDGSLDYRYSLSLETNGTRAELLNESLVKLRIKKSGGATSETRLFYTGLKEKESPGISGYFYSKTQGPGRKIELNRSVTILSQVETLNVRKEVSEGARTVISAMKRVFVLDPIPSHMRDYAPLSDTLSSDASNAAGVLAGLGAEKRCEVEAVITRFVGKLPEQELVRVFTEKVGKFGADAMLYCEESWAEGKTQVVDARGMSDGTLRFLGIMVALLTCEKGSLLVVEEVDNGLHPSRAHLLVEMLHEVGGERGVDVVMTTHSPALLNALGDEMIPFITVAHRDVLKGYTKLTLLEELKQLPKLMASGPVGQHTASGAIESGLKASGKASVI